MINIYMNLSVWINDWQGVWNQSWIKDWLQIGILLPVHVSGTGWKVVWHQSARLILRGSAWSQTDTGCLAAWFQYKQRLPGLFINC